MRIDTNAVAQQDTAVGSRLVEAAAELVPTLRSRNVETNALARLPTTTVQDFETAHLFEMLVPAIYGGVQCSLETFMDAIVQIGRRDGSAAWTLSILSASTWMAATLYPQHVVDEVFGAGQKFRTASVLSPLRVKTRPVDGGVMIEDGLWSFNSGIYHAHWDILGIPIFDDAGRQIDLGSALVPVFQVTLSHDWDTIGLRGSGSSSVSVKDVFVPNECIALASKILREDYASTHLRDEPLYRMPLVPFLSTKLVFPALGMAKAALELFVEHAPRRGIAYTFYEKQDEAAVTHLQVGEASSKIDAAEALLRRSVHDLGTSTAVGIRMPLEQRIRIRRDAGYASQLLWEAVDLLAGASGGSFAKSDNTMNQLWRDVRVAGHYTVEYAPARPRSFSVGFYLGKSRTPNSCNAFVNSRERHILTGWLLPMRSAVVDPVWIPVVLRLAGPIHRPIEVDPLAEIFMHSESADAILEK
jgi:3-hydroxy-9,10-secoandrosta-1,3,5(10)-triene-9,17-dione monooxygenase